MGVTRAYPGGPSEEELDRQRAQVELSSRSLLQSRGILPGAPSLCPSQIQVVTPFNVPAELTGDEV